MGRLPDSRENQLSPGSDRCFHCANRIDELRSKSLRRFRKSIGFDPNTIARTGENGFRLQCHLEFESREQSAEFTANDFSINPLFPHS